MSMLQKTPMALFFKKQNEIMASVYFYFLSNKIFGAEHFNLTKDQRKELLDGHGLARIGGWPF